MRCLFHFMSGGRKSQKDNNGAARQISKGTGRLGLLNDHMCCIVLVTGGIVMEERNTMELYIQAD